MKPGNLLFCAAAATLAAAWIGGAARGEDAPTAAARRVAREIRREALLPPNGPEGRPLPLASHWNAGTVRNTFDADHQIGLIQAGHHILPWIGWPSGDPHDERFDAYFGRLLRYFQASSCRSRSAARSGTRCLSARSIATAPKANGPA